MKRMLHTVLIASMVLFSVCVNAQKLGHINTNEILSAMPEADEAQEKIQEKANEFDKNLKDLQNELNTLYAEYIEGINNKTLVDPLKSEKEKELDQLQQKLQLLNTHSVEKLKELRQQLLNPIIAKLRMAINETAAENGFVYIFDLSVGSIIYTSSSSEDISAKVKQKLGL